MPGGFHMTKKLMVAFLAGFVGAGAFALASVAQDATKAQPNSYRVVFENSSVRVLEYNAIPGMGVCGSGVHSHPAHLTVVLSPARVKVTEGGRTFIAENKSGDVFWSNAVTHET